MFVSFTMHNIFITYDMASVDSLKKSQYNVYSASVYNSRIREMALIIRFDFVMRFTYQICVIKDKSPQRTKQFLKKNEMANCIVELLLDTDICMK